MEVKPEPVAQKSSTLQCRQHRVQVGLGLALLQQGVRDITCGGCMHCRIWGSRRVPTSQTASQPRYSHRGTAALPV